MDPTKKELYTAKRSTNLDLSDPNITQRWDLIRSDASSESWMLLRVDGSKGIFYCSGQGLNEMIGQLNDDDMYFGVLRAVVDGRTKFYHIYFVGANTGGMKKGKGSLYKTSIFNLFDGAHGEISFSGGLDEAIPSAFIHQIQSLTGVGQENISV